MQIIVLGMHRSGASAVAGLIERMGATFAAPELGARASIENGRDLFERRDVRRLHDSLLHSCGLEWPRLDPASAELLATMPFQLLQPRGRQIVDSFRGHEPWFLKEPQMCFLLPFWRHLLEQPVCVHVVRHPLEIAASLKIRNGFSIQHSVALWELSSVFALRNSAGLPQIFIRYADLLGDPIRAAAELLRQLEEAGVGGLTHPEESEITGFIQADLCRQRAVSGTISEFLNGKQIALHQALQDPHAGLSGDFPAISEGAAEILAIQKNIWEVSQKNVQELVEVQKSARRSWQTHWKLTRLQESAKNHLDDSFSLLHSFQQEHLKTLNSLPWIFGNLLYLRIWILSRTERLRKLRLLESEMDHQRYKLRQSSPIMAESENTRRNREKRIRPVSIIISIYDGLEDMVACIESVLLHTHHPHEILLLDDRSTDERIWPRIREYSKAHEHIRSIRNKRRLGYTASVNIGLEFARPCDVVLLGSHTIVTPFWLEKLTAAAYSRAAVATVSAVSNGAGAVSVLIRSAENALPDDLSPAEFSWWVEKLTTRRRPVVPAGETFCLFILRAALEKVGLFDESSFPYGFGAEKDFCLRAQEGGLLNLVDDATFIYQNSQSLLPPEKIRWRDASEVKVEGLHPAYKGLREQWSNVDPVAELRREVQKAPWLSPRNGAPAKPLLLYVIHASGGGTRYTSEDLIRGLTNRYDVLLLETSEYHWTLIKAIGRRLVAVRRYHFAEKWQYYLPVNRERLDVLAEILNVIDIELVHFRHLIGNGPEALDLVKRKGLQVVLSLHDFYTICPTTTLLDENLQYCGGTCTPGIGTCQLLGRWFDHSGPPLKHAFVHVHQKLMSDALASTCDALITTSEFSRNLIARHFPRIAPRIHVIEHGRDLPHEELAVEPASGQKIRLICLGTITVPKGLNLIRDVMAFDQARERRFEFHFLGSLPKDLEKFAHLGGIVHGKYKREALSSHLREIGPSFSLISSIWPETYCHTLTESWAFGLPVFASNLGTLQERVTKNGGGWLLDHRSPEAWYEGMLTLIDRPADYQGKREEIRRMHAKSVAEMTADYIQIYRSLTAESEN